MAQRHRSRRSRGPCPGAPGRRFRAPVAALALAALCPWPVAASADAPRWERLEFSARKLFLSAEATVEFAPEAAPPADDRCAGRPPMPESAARMRVESSMLGRHSRSSLWFDAETLGAWVRVQEDRGRRNRYKLQVFCHGSVQVERATPNPGEAELPVKKWTHRYPQVHELPTLLDAPLSEPSVLLHLVGRLARPGLEPSRTIPVFSNRQVLAVRIDRDPELVRAAPGFTASGGLLPETLTLVRFRLTPVAIGGEGTARDFRLLGLEGGVEIVAARELQLPVAISGRIAPAGRVKVRLIHVEFRGDL